MERRRCRAATSRRNTRVSWSYPTGKALIAPAVADNHLLWRTAGQPETRTDISFLERPTSLAYHPAGRNIFAAGQAADGTAGLFIAGNRGENPRLIAQLDQPTTVITEIAADPSGSRVTSSTITATARSTSTRSIFRH